MENGRSCNGEGARWSRPTPATMILNRRLIFTSALEIIDRDGIVVEHGDGG
jgi:hypothetical protein